ncbi:MAG: hypothetical protein JO349_00590 [Candidatus Eremiobacteraeota bacterium]|nr:hypothetical protein [Candidatus Eremiobacteraeota bacterium]
MLTVEDVGLLTPLGSLPLSVRFTFAAPLAAGNVIDAPPSPATAPNCTLLEPVVESVADFDDDAGPEATDDDDDEELPPPPQAASIAAMITASRP